MRLLAILLTALPLATLAQVPTPAPSQARPILITGATLHVGNGTVVPNAAVAFDQGKLTYAGPAAGFSGDKSAYETIAADGQQLYPGLIVPSTTLGLTEIEAIRASVDEAEVGSLNPNVRSLIAYNTDSDILPTVRTNGVLLAQPTPRGGLLSGQSSVVQLDAWNWQDAVVRVNPNDDAAQLDRRQKSRENQLHDLEQLFAEAAAYRQLPAGRRENLRLAALSG